MRSFLCLQQWMYFSWLLGSSAFAFSPPSGRRRPVYCVSKTLRPSPLWIAAPRRDDMSIISSRINQHQPSWFLSSTSSSTSTGRQSKKRRSWFFALWSCFLLPYKLLQRIVSVGGKTGASTTSSSVVAPSEVCSGGKDDTATIPRIETATENDLIKVFESSSVDKEESTPTVSVADDAARATPATSDTSPTLLLSESQVQFLVKHEQQQQESTSSQQRWELGAVDLSGKWRLVVNADFRQAYGEYLENLGQPLVVRTLAPSLVGLTSEELVQEGSQLWIKGACAQSIWERTLTSSGTTISNDASRGDSVVEIMKKPIFSSIRTADGQDVQAEAWWTDNGSVHKSWMYGVSDYGGGAFSSERYLDADGCYVCESIFHPKDPNRKQARVTWKFQREE